MSPVAHRPRLHEHFTAKLANSSAGRAGILHREDGVALLCFSPSEGEVGVRNACETNRQRARLHRQDNLAEMLPAFEITLRGAGFRQRETLVHGDLKFFLCDQLENIVKLLKLLRLCL